MYDEIRSFISSSRKTNKVSNNKYNFYSRHKEQVLIFSSKFSLFVLIWPNWTVKPSRYRLSRTKYYIPSRVKK
jgi:hypothetical protein